MKSLFYHICISLIVYSELSIGKPSKPRQFNNLSFAIPALNLLGGGGNNAGTGATGGNIFRQATVTRTIIRTVSTIAQGIPRTCTASLPANLPACPGRRRRSADAAELQGVAEPSIMVVIGTTSITDQAAVSKLLNLGPNSDTDTADHLSPTTLRSLNDEEDLTTKLYPSGDSSDNSNDEIYSADVTDGSNSDKSIETQVLDATILQNFDEVSAAPNGTADSDGRAGFNFAGTTTSTVTISITAVTTSYVSGSPSVTLTVSYAGCSASTFPVTGTPC